MLELEVSNAMSKAVGTSHGVLSADLKHFLKDHAPEVREVFRRHSEPGYAFTDLPDDTKNFRKIRAFAASQRKKWENIVVLGIGGSALGGIAVKEALLGAYHDCFGKPRCFFVDNVDPEPLDRLLNSLDLKKTCFIVISKSGGTTEPMAAFGAAMETLKKAVKKPAGHFIFITDPKQSILKDLGTKLGIPLFEVPPGIGGRFSVLTPVGLLPCAMAGMDISGLLKGAAAMRNRIKKAKPEENPALILAALQFLLDRRKHKTMTVMFPYSNRLFRVGDWYRQLLAESIGKNEKTGPTPITALGTTDQHSQLQLYNEGPHDKWFIFLRIASSGSKIGTGKNLPEALKHLNHQKLETLLDASCEGTIGSLTQSKRPNVTLRIPALDAHAVGELFMLFEFQVALLGMFYKVNAFNQPGVEASKKITQKILQEKTK